MSYLAELVRLIKPKLSKNYLQVAMSGTMDDKPDHKEIGERLKAFQEKYFPKAYIRKNTTKPPVLSIRFLDEELKQKEIDAIGCFERAMIPIVSEIEALLEPLQIPYDEIKILKTQNPRYS